MQLLHYCLVAATSFEAMEPGGGGFPSSFESLECPAIVTPSALRLSTNVHIVAMDALSRSNSENSNAIDEGATIQALPAVLHHAHTVEGSPRQGPFPSKSSHTHDYLLVNKY